MKVRELIAQLQDDIDQEAEVIIEPSSYPPRWMKIQAIEAYRDGEGRRLILIVR